MSNSSLKARAVRQNDHNMNKQLIQQQQQQQQQQQRQ